MVEAGRSAQWGPAERSDRHTALEGLTSSVRRLVEATVATGHDVTELRALAADVDAIAARAEAERDDDPWVARSYGPGISEAHHLMGINPAIGACNPTAPVVRLDVGEAGLVTGTVRFGLAHVGPPYRAHGGIIASVFDQALGLAVIAAGSPGMTRSLTVTYRRATPLHEDLRIEARFEGMVGDDGRTSRSTGVILDGDGKVTAEGEAVFTQPRGERKR